MKVTKPDKNINFPEMEKKILEKWDRENTFQESITSRPNEKKFNFYDGPPFATGLPHFGHFITSALKDSFARFFTLKGYRVERRFGWDCHGVPVEMLVQKELGLKGKKDIEPFGVDKFNAACRASVTKYTEEWKNYIKRYGRWVDMDHPYHTMDTDFMESVWAVFKQLYDKNYIYEGKFVVSYSPALGTTLSNFEASLDYRDVQDPSLTVKAWLKGNHSGKALLVWTTTPWTLPANVVIAIDAKATYAEVKDPATQEHYYLLKDAVSRYWPKEGSISIIREFLGHELVNTEYEPFFSHFIKHAGDKAFRLLATEYVLHDTGTGAVHTAPAFGEDDFHCAKHYGLELIDHLDTNGHYLEGNLPEVVGLDFKSGEKTIITDLKKRNMVFKHETLNHSYPFCYRSGTPLMYRAVPSWFVKIEEFREKFLKSNEKINWVPEHIKEGRFGKWLQQARDWNIGRSRYWGNPIPIWKNDSTGETLCIGSIEELSKYTNKKITDLHMEFIDDIKIPSPTGRGMLTRVPFVLDCWFESGSMPYAQNHYPFKRKDEFETLFPADFICEGLDQTRAWFYTLTLLSTLLFDEPAFKNVIVNGLVLAEDGKKMSKSLKNYPDPMLTLNEFGADSLRLFLLSSPATLGEETRFHIEGVKECTRKILLPLWNAYSFFATYASIDGFDPEVNTSQSQNELDEWILLKLQDLSLTVQNSMSHYYISKATHAISEFLDDLNNWYIRRSRRRFWSSSFEAHSTLYRVLVEVSQLLSPFAPFAAEFFYEKLSLTEKMRKDKSVHLSYLPEYPSLTAKQKKCLDETNLIRRIVELGRNTRIAHKIKIRQPLNSLTIGVLEKEVAETIALHQHVILEELNIKSLEVTLNPSELAKIVVKPNFKTLGKTLGDKMKELQATLTQLPENAAIKALAKENIVIELSGKPITLTPHDVVVELRSSGEKVVATDAEIVVALDTTLTDELKMEGIAREIVSIVQKARKSADFAVEERIHLLLKAPAFLNDAIQKNKNYIEEETLSYLLDNAISRSPRHSEIVTHEGQTIQLELFDGASS